MRVGWDATSTVLRYSDPTLWPVCRSLPFLGPLGCGLGETQRLLYFVTPILPCGLFAVHSPFWDLFGAGWVRRNVYCTSLLQSYPLACLPFTPLSGTSSVRVGWDATSTVLRYSNPTLWPVCRSLPFLGPLGCGLGETQRLLYFVTPILPCGLFAVHSPFWDLLGAGWVRRNVYCTSLLRSYPVACLSFTPLSGTSWVRVGWDATSTVLRYSNPTLWPVCRSLPFLGPLGCGLGETQRLLYFVTPILPCGLFAVHSPFWDLLGAGWVRRNVYCTSLLQSYPVACLPFTPLSGTSWVRVGWDATSTVLRYSNPTLWPFCRSLPFLGPLGCGLGETQRLLYFVTPILPCGLFAVHSPFWDLFAFLSSYWIQSEKFFFVYFRFFFFFRWFRVAIYRLSVYLSVSVSVCVSLSLFSLSLSLYIYIFNILPTALAENFRWKKLVYLLCVPGTRIISSMARTILLTNRGACVK